MELTNIQDSFVYIMQKKINFSNIPLSKTKEFGKEGTLLKNVTDNRRGSGSETKR